MKWLIPVLCCVLLAGAGIGHLVAGQRSRPAVEIGFVDSVVDGDTIYVRLEDGRRERVRYIGINTPESDEPCSREATRANTALVEGKTVAMLRDVSDRDRHGRLLRYVFVGGTFVNAALVEQGWAEAVEYPPDTLFADFFERLEVSALESNKGCHPYGVFAAAQGVVRPVAAT